MGLPSKISSRIGRSVDCWEWIGGKNGVGRAYVPWEGKSTQAARVVYELLVGDIPEDMHVLHTCDNMACVNPHHLWLGTCLDNMRDKVSKGRQARGERHGRNKLTDAEREAIRNDQRPPSVVAREYPVTAVHISNLQRS